MCRAKACWRTTFPVPVFLNRLDAPLCVFSLGMTMFREIKILPHPSAPCPRPAYLDHMLPEHLLRPGFKSVRLADQPDFPGAPPVRERYEPATGVRLRRHRRHRGNSHSGRHHRQNGRKMPALKHHVRPHPALAARRDQAVAKTVPLLQQEKTLVPQLGQVHAAPPRLFVFFRQHRIESLLEQIRARQSLSLDRGGHDGSIDFSGMDALEQNRSNLLRHPNVYARMPFRKSIQNSRQQIRCDGWNYAHRNLAAFLAAHLLNLSLRFAQLAQNSFRARQKRPPENRELRGARCSIEQPRPEFLLKLANLLRKRWLRHVLGFRCPRERPVARHRTEIAELMYFHPARTSRGVQCSFAAPMRNIGTRYWTYGKVSHILWM